MKRVGLAFLIKYRSALNWGNTEISQQEYRIIRCGIPGARGFLNFAISQTHQPQSGILCGICPDSFDLVSLRARSGTHYHLNHISHARTLNLTEIAPLQSRSHFQCRPLSKRHSNLTRSTIIRSLSKALSTLFRTQPISPDDPLCSHAFGSFTRAHVIDEVKELLLRASIDPANFSCHLFWKGAAVSAAARGISRENIKLIGRWRSDAIDIYINELAKEDY